MEDAEFVDLLKEVDPEEFLETPEKEIDYLSPMLMMDLSDPAIRAWLHRHTRPSSYYIPKVISLDSEDTALVPAAVTSQEVVADFMDLVESDFALSRNNLRKIANISVEAVQDLANLAKHHDSPRAYVILTEVIKTAVESNKEVVNLHDIKNKIATPQNPQIVNNEQNNTNNTIFVGSTTDLNQIAAQIIASRKDG